MSQKILSTEEHNTLMRELDAERNRVPECACTNGGTPVKIGDHEYIFRSPACRVHYAPSSRVQMAETGIAQSLFEHEHKAARRAGSHPIREGFNGQ